MAKGDSQSRLVWVTWCLAFSVPALAVFHCLVVLGLAALRAAHPYDIEWMEGVVVDHILRVLAGEPLYVAPTLDFTPLIYPPFFYYVGAAATLVFGEGLLAPRLVSIAASIGCLVVLFLFARRETGEASAGLLAAGLYAATFELSGGWFDLARIDNLFMALLLGGSYLVRFHTSTRTLLLAGGLMFLAAFTKQTAIVVAGALCLQLLLAQGLRSALTFGLSFGVPLLVSALSLHLVSDGWHSYYVYILPSEHLILPAYLGIFFLHDLLRPLPIASLLFITLLASAALRVRNAVEEERSRLLFYLLFLPALMLGSAGSRIHVGGAGNVLLPAYAAVALGVAVAASQVVSGRVLATSMKAGFVGPLVSVALLAQLAMLAFDPRPYVPNEATVRAGDRFVAEIEAIEGDVFTPDHGYLGARVGKKSFAHYVPLWDVLRGGPSRVQLELLHDMRQRIRGREFDAIFIHQVSRLTRDLKTPIRRDYIEAGLVLPEGWRFAPLGVHPGNAVKLLRVGNKRG
jgi:4-amino-4-deoxy-L-arabinose transferase-like glycosyltransferase